MPEHPSQPPTYLSRRALLATGLPAAAGGTLILGAGPAYSTPRAGQEGDPTEAHDLTIRANDAGSVTIAAADGTDLVRLPGYQIAAGIEGREGVVEVDEEQDGTHVIRITYDEFSDLSHSGLVTYRCRPRKGRCRVGDRRSREHRLHGREDPANTSRSRLARRRFGTRRDQLPR